MLLLRLMSLDVSGIEYLIGIRFIDNLKLTKLQQKTFYHNQTWLLQIQ